MICEKCQTPIPSDGTPYCTSEKCLTKKILEVVLSAEGGYLTTVEGFKYPMRGYPKGQDLHMVDVLKRVIISSIRLLETKPFTPKRFLAGIAKWMGEVYRASFRVAEQKEEKEYTESSNEVRRVLLKLNPYEDSDWVKYIVEIWETDQAYRFRPQDIIPETDFIALGKNPRKEILRLLDLVYSREIIGGQHPKISAVRKVLKIVLLFKSFRNPIVSFLKELDMDKIRLNVNDRYWCANKFDYNYEGKSYDERMAWKNEEDKNWERPVEAVEPEKPRIAINTPNEAFYKLAEQEAKNMCDSTAKALMENWRKMQPA